MPTIINKAGRKITVVGPVSPPRKSRALTKVQKKQVKKLIKGQSEIKRATWYNTYNDGSSSSRATGDITVWGYAAQNNIITTNNTDALRLVPNVKQGTDDYNRIGDRISVASLKLNGFVRVAIQTMAEFTPTDIRVVLYVLQHKQLKDYNSFYTANNFNQLLDNDEGGTQSFAGTPLNEDMRIADQYYTLHAKKVITLRYAGASANEGGVVSIANCHNYFAKFSMNLTKFVPKTLKFPETFSSVPAEFANSPTNSSLFLAMGFINQKGSSNFADPTVLGIQQTYQSKLLFRDA